jgi:TPP-dependent pyruvate/acetoin dehydrogenase alpha subunit
MKSNALGKLAEPSFYTEALNIKGFSKEQLSNFLFKMLLIRKAEEKIADNVVAGKIKCPCHLGIGQEAIAVGISAYLRKTDRVFGAHRSHAHFLAINDNVYSLFAEVLGRESGSSQGMGGSMHIIDKENGFWGSVPIVGATIPISTGAALAAKFDGNGDIAVSYFGDGAAEEGVFHESMNLAASMDLPVLFVCENNLFASHMHVDLRQPSNSVARYAKAHLVKYAVIDGNDAAEVAKTTKRAVKYIRETNNPFFLEVVTYRWRGHVGPNEDNDVGLQRSDELLQWRKRDPIRRLVEAMTANGSFSQTAFEALKTSVQQIVDDAWTKAEASAFPPISNLLDLVYSPSKS